MIIDPKTWKRTRERLALKLPVRVHCRETHDSEWVEITRLADVTPFGVGFSLQHPIEKGRLLHMTILCQHNSGFDHAAKRYETASTAKEIGEEADQVLEALTLSKQRRFTRHSTPVDILLEVQDERRNVNPI